jgi:methylenetetrahydrofolate--tRNA-(uracil-5-)-methyltransferase
VSIHIIGGGLAGSEAAWQAAALGVPVVLHEMRPVRPTAVHKTGQLGELVCSNSFRGDKLDNAVGLLKEEMRRLGSLVIRAADENRVPAGAALAVDRERFSQAVTRAIHAHPLITVVREEITSVTADPAMSPLIVATGPLTSEALSADVAALVGAEHLYFYDHQPDRPGRKPRHEQGVSRIEMGPQPSWRRVRRVSRPASTRRSAEQGRVFRLARGCLRCRRR